MQKQVIHGIEYVVAFSPQMQAITVMMGDSAKSQLKIYAENLLEGLSEEVFESLRKESIAGISQAMRQIDLRNDAKKIVMKAFVHWYPYQNCWCVCFELPNETHFEGKTVGKG